MNKEEKLTVVMALINKQISKDEAKKVLKADPKARIFKSLIHPNGKIEPLPFGDQTLKPIFEKCGINFISINRKLIK